MDLVDIAGARLANQRLVNPPSGRPEDVVSALGAVQAQDYAGAKWALGLRLGGDTDADIERALDQGRILRTHVLRPTWHFVAPPDIRWMLALTAPRVRAAMAYYDRQLDITERLCRRSQAVLTKALAGGNHLTREELGQALARAGIEARGPRLGNLMLRAELDAVVCSGPRRGKQFTYALLDERAPAAPSRDRDEALAELASRYFTSHGPALVQDFSWWSGLTVNDAQRAAALAGARLRAVTVAGRTFWRGARARRATATTPAPVIHLLPSFDEYLVAYKDRDVVSDPAASGRRDLGGPTPIANPFVLRAGRVVGTWRRSLEKKKVIVEVRPLVTLTARERRELGAAVLRLGAFLQRPSELRP